MSFRATAPVLFLARGHTGTRAVTRLLMEAGFYMGDPDDPNILNDTYDSLPFTFDFQRCLLPGRFLHGSGRLRPIDQEVLDGGRKALSRHLKGRTPQRWGIKTCDGMFMHEYYRALFPDAKYIHLVRDGRDVIFSGDGYFQITNPKSRADTWEYFKIITFGLDQYGPDAPFPLPEHPSSDDEMMRHRFWVQAKSWIEHERMMRVLRSEGRLSPNVITMRYEDLCRDPEVQIARLFAFLEEPIDSELISWAEKHMRVTSIGRWRRLVEEREFQENIHVALESMLPELRLQGYDA